jgi:dephospho-CoA kinase
MAAAVQTRPALRIGLTGGIGSGKSTVAGLLAQCGAHLIDTDAISRQLTLPGGPALAPLRAAFGDTLFTADGALDRNRLREQVFADAQAKQRLEGILHPLIGAECARQAAGVKAGATLVFDVPLLVEGGRWRGRVDRVLVVDCSEATQVERVMRRSGWSAEAVRAVIAQQASREARRAVADAVVFNDRLTLAQLAAEIDALWRRWVPVEQSPSTPGPTGP